MAETHSLVCHTATKTELVRYLEVTVDYLASGALRLRYGLGAKAPDLRIPVKSEPAPQDGLWRHLCFEAFVAGADAPAYREFNFSPSTQWAAYGFSAYREGSAPLAIPDPDIRWTEFPQEQVLQCRIAAEALPSGVGLRLGLAAVVEDSLGKLSYWALHHPSTRPDFHRPESMRLELNRP